MKFSEARSIAWKLLMLSPFLRSEERAHRIARLLATHKRKSVQGPVTRWGFNDGSVLELVCGKYRVVKT